MRKLLSLLSCITLLISSAQLSAQSNQYLHFDAVNDYAETPAGAQYVAGAEGVSMTGWFYTDELIYGQGMLSIRGGGTGDGEMYVIQLSDGVLECRFISTAGFHQVVAPAGTIEAGVWQHLAWVYNGSSIELFVDGVSAGSASASGTLESLDRGFTMGKSNVGGYNFVFGGRMDEVTLWSKGLTEAEILAMMADEPLGDEAGLELYYKMNQGVPGADNTSISTLTSEVGGEERNADLLGFALSGAESNFNGELESGFQSIAFPQIPAKLVSDAPFELNASVSSGLPIDYSVISGPATVAGSILTLDGIEGEVTLRASQAGNGVFDAAQDVEVTFDVVDPATHLADIDLRNPIAGDFYASALSPIRLASIIDVAYPELFEITEIVFAVDGEIVPHTDYGNKHQTAWWTPSDFGSHTLSVTATHNEGTSHTESVTFNVTSTAVAQTVPATVDVWVDAFVFEQEVEAVLPSYVGAYDQIQGLLDIGCPQGGCDPWDRVSSIEVKGHNGEWYEIIRYLTPYGVACNHEIDLTDFMSLLEGKVRFRVTLGTQGNGFLYSLDLDYQVGVPEHAYSSIDKLWYQTYAFGDMSDMIPTETFIMTYPENALASTLKVVSSGHGWGANNTGNAAEFHEDTHHFWVNGTQTFEQLNWVDCNPNPDGCSPQFGTWQFDRAGWCPGSIAQFFDYNMNPYIGSADVNLEYIFNQDYTDFCHPNNPNCVTGQTCDNCNDGFNPHLIVSSYLITLGDAPLGESQVLVGLDELAQGLAVDIRLFPNPSAGRFAVDITEVKEAGTLIILDLSGKEMQRERFAAGQERIDVTMQTIKEGVYLVQLRTASGVLVRKLVVE